MQTKLSENYIDITVYWADIYYVKRCARIRKIKMYVIAVINKDYSIKSKNGLLALLYVHN